MGKSIAEHHVRLVAETAQYEAQMKSAAGASRALASEQKKAAIESQASGNAASSFGRNIQNVGFQVQDFAVQVAGGQGALRALSQQLPQTLGAFGPAGAIAGAAVSVGALAYQIWNSADAASSASDKFKTLKDATDALTESKRQLALIGKDEFSELPFFESEAQRTQAELNAIRLQIATKQAQSDSLTKQIQELESQGFAESALALSREARSLAPTEADKIAMAAAENAATQAQIKLGELKEKQFQKDRQNENALLDINVKRIGEEITAEFKKSEQIEKLDEFRAKKQKERIENALQSFFSDIGRGNMDKTILGLQSRMPEALKINTGASALGGVTGSGTASQALDIQKQILDSLRTLVRMEQMASSGYN